MYCNNINEILLMINCIRFLIVYTSLFFKINVLKCIKLLMGGVKECYIFSLLFQNEDIMPKKMK